MNRVDFIKKYVWVIFLLILMSIIATGLITFFAVNHYSRKGNIRDKNMDKDMDRVIDELLVPIRISRFMSHNQFLLQWMHSGEENQQIAIDYLRNIKKEWGYDAFIFSNLSKKYYFSDGSIRDITPSTPDSGWLFDMLENEMKTLIDIGYHKGDFNQPYLYCDFMISSAQNLILGYVGLAVDLKKLSNFLQSYEIKYNVNLHFVNEKDVIVLSSNPQIINLEATDFAWYNSDNKNIRTEESFNSVMQLQGVNWKLYSEEKHKTNLSVFFRLFFLNLAVFVIFLAIITYILMIIINRLKSKLQQSIDNVKRLKGIVPICSVCKKIRDDSGYWQQLENYIHENSDADLSHGICPDCAKELYGIDVEEGDDN